MVSLQCHGFINVAQNLKQMKSMFFCYILLHCIKLHCTALNHMTLHYKGGWRLHNSAGGGGNLLLHSYITMHCNVMQCNVIYITLHYRTGWWLHNNAGGGGNLLLLHSCNQWHCNACNTDDTTTIFAIVIIVFKIKIIMCVRIHSSRF